MGNVTVESLLSQARVRLTEAGIAEAELEARLLAQETLRLGHAQLVAHQREQVPPPVAAEMEALLRRRLQREPLAYVLGWTEFYGRRFACDRRALVPRPETETLVEAAVEVCRELEPGEWVADVGTGSGVIAVTLALENPRLHLWATDVSGMALQVARLNVQRHRVAERVHLVEGSLLAPLLAPERAGQVAVVVCNLPYVPAGELARLQPEVRDWEPRQALDGGPDGLRLCGELLRQAAGLPRLRALLLEVGHDQAAAVAHLAEANLPGAQVRTYRDLQGVERVVAVRLPRAVPVLMPAGGLEAVGDG